MQLDQHGVYHHQKREEYVQQLGQYPMTRLRFARLLSRLLRRAVSCSLPCQCVRSCHEVSFCIATTFVWTSYWTMSGRIGELKTAGRGWVDPLAVPSAEMMPTVGLEDILRTR